MWVLQVCVAGSSVGLHPFIRSLGLLTQTAQAAVYWPKLSRVLVLGEAIVIVIVAGTCYLAYPLHINKNSLRVYSLSYQDSHQ